MNDLFADPRIRETLTENLWRYLAVVYADRRGLNITNNMAHGLIPRAAFARRMGDLVFHTLLALSLMRASERKQKVSENGKKKNRALPQDRWTH